MQKYSVPFVPQCSVRLEHGKSLILKAFLPLLVCLFQCSNIYIKVAESQNHFTMLSGEGFQVGRALGKALKTRNNGTELTTKLVTIWFHWLFRHWKTRNMAGTCGTMLKKQAILPQPLLKKQATEETPCNILHITTAETVVTMFRLPDGRSVSNTACHVARS